MFVSFVTLETLHQHSKSFTSVPVKISTRACSRPMTKEKNVRMECVRFSVCLEARKNNAHSGSKFVRFVIIWQSLKEETVDIKSLLHTTKEFEKKIISHLWISIIGILIWNNFLKLMNDIPFNFLRLIHSTWWWNRTSKTHEIRHTRQKHTSFKIKNWNKQ